MDQFTMAVAISATSVAIHLLLFPDTDVNNSPFPHLFLALASATTLFSGAVLANHTRLVDGELRQGHVLLAFRFTLTTLRHTATGPIFLPWWWTSKAFVKANRFLANPYTVTVAGTCALLLVAGIIVPR